MGVDELNLKYCSAQKFLDIYTQMTNVDATVDCISAITTIKRVLKKEHDLADPDCKTLFPNIFSDKKEKKPEPQPKPEPKNEQTIQLPYFSSSSADEKEPLNLYCECEGWGSCRTSLADKVFIKLYSSENPRMEIGITPGAIRYYKSSLDDLENEYVYSKDGLSGTISPKSTRIFFDEESYYVQYLESGGWFSKLGITHEIYDGVKPQRDTKIVSFRGKRTGSFILDRKNLNLHWSTFDDYPNYHVCEIIQKNEFNKKLLKIVKKTFKSELKKYKKAQRLESKKAEAAAMEKARLNKI
jgi:hypothetical protein